MKTTGNRITLSYDNFTHGVSGKELCSLVAAQIGKIVRSCVRMTAPNWESLEDAEKFKVIRELSVHFNVEQRNEMLDAINATASDVYRRWKHALHIHYEEHGACSVPEEFESRKDEWEWLVKHFESPEYQRRSKANKGNRSKKLYHHGSSSCKIINIAKELRDAGSKFPHIDAGYAAYYRPGRSDDIGSQRAVRMKQLASNTITKAHSQNPDTPIEQISPLSLDTEISMADASWGRRAGKEVRALGRAVHRELNQESTSSRRSNATEAQEQVREAIEKARVAEEEARACRNEVLEVRAQLSTMMDFLSLMGMATSSCQRNDPPPDSELEDDDPNNGGIGNLQTLDRV